MQLEEWWLDRAYLRSRESLVSTTNFALVWSGIGMPEPFHKKKERTRAFTAAVFLHQILRLGFPFKYKYCKILPKYLDWRLN